MPPRPDADHPVFHTRWIHAFEDDTPESEVYRPEGDDLPLSRRPRRHLALFPDGSARVSVPGPDDRPVEVDATWDQEGDDLVVRTKDEHGRAAQALRVSLHSSTRLLVRKR